MGKIIDYLAEELKADQVQRDARRPRINSMLKNIANIKPNLLRWTSLVTE